MPTSDLPSLETHPYQEFFHIYKPINKYRKSDPGPPDFRLVVISYVPSSSTLYPS
jgi:tRNA-splicing endonuclease subunit Sen54